MVAQAAARQIAQQQYVRVMHKETQRLATLEQRRAWADRLKVEAAERRRRNREQLAARTP